MNLPKSKRFLLIIVIFGSIFFMHSDHLPVPDSQKDKEITPATPHSAESFTLTHESELLGGEMLDLAIDGDYAYAAVGVRGIDIFDISNPSSPRKINTWNASLF